MAKEVLACPNCGHRFKTEIKIRYNLDKNPRIIKELIQGRFNVMRCPKCNKKIVLSSHVLLTSYQPPRWLWLVSKKHQHPDYPQEFMSKIAPPVSEKVIKQEMIFVKFGEPCPAIKFVLEEAVPKTASDYVSWGKLLTGNEAINRYKKALRLNKNHKEAKKLLNQELDALKTYSISYSN